MTSIVIAGYARSPFHFAKKGGLINLRPDDLAAQVLKGLVSKLDLAPGQLEDVIMGCAYPEAEQGIAYGAPAFRIAGTTVAGFSAAKQHLSYLPHSGTIVGSLTVEELAGFSATKGAVKMPVGTPLPASLVRRLIELRRTEAGV